MARKEVTPAIKFDQAFDMAYRLAVKRLAADRRQGQVSLNKNASQFSEVGGSKSGKLPFVRSKEESLWAVHVLRKIGEKLTAEEGQANKSRRRSSVEQSFKGFGDVVFAAQLARKEMMMGTSPKSEKAGTELRRNSCRTGSFRKSSVTTLLKRYPSHTELSTELELKEILNPPDAASMHTRFRVDDIASFPHSELVRITEAFYRFKSIGSSDIDVDDLEKVLSHLGYLKIDPQEIAETTQKLTKFSTLDYEEYMRFMRAYTSYERSEVQRVFRAFDEDGSGSLDTEEIEQVMCSFNITPFRSTVESAIAVVDEDCTGTVEFHEFVHLLTIYMKTEGFTRHEVKDLYSVFWQFALTSSHPVAANANSATSANTHLREIPAARLRDALMDVFGPQSADFAAKIVNRVIRQMEKKKEEKVAKRALRDGGGQKPEEQGMKFREFLLVARRLREAEIEEYRRIFEKISTPTGCLKQGDLGRLLQHFGYMPLQVDIDDLLERNNMQEEQVDLERFVALVQDFNRTDGFSRKDLSTIHEAFCLFDEGTGQIDVLQVAAMLRWMGYSIEHDRADSYFQAVNYKGESLLGFVPLLCLMRLHREDNVRRIRDVFEQHCNDELVIKQERLKKALTQLDRRASVSVIGTCLKGVPNTGRIDFEDFVKVMDYMQTSSIPQTRKQAGFTEDEVNVFRQSFEKYDLDGNGKLAREELSPLLADINISMRTVEDQRRFLTLLEDARKEALHCGATVEEVGEPGSPGIAFWTFIHLMRLLQTQQDVEATQEHRCKHSFNEKELEELRVIFRTWCAVFLDDMKKFALDFADDIRVNSGDIDTMDDSELKLSFDTLELLFRQLGVPITPTHMKQLKGKMILDPQNGLPVHERAYLVDCNGFFRLLAFMLDSNFAGLRETSEEIAQAPAGVLGDFE